MGRDQSSATTVHSVNSHLKQENVTFLVSSATKRKSAQKSHPETNNNNNNRLFMVPHLIRAQSTYKDIRIHSFHHTGKCNIYHFFYCLQPEEKAVSECTLGTGKCKQHLLSFLSSPTRRNSAHKTCTEQETAPFIISKMGHGHQSW